MQSNISPFQPTAASAHRIRGTAIGIVAIHALNLSRVVTLFYLGQWNRDVFEWAHLYVWQALIMLDVLIVWIIWVRCVAGPANEPQRIAGGTNVRG